MRTSAASTGSGAVGIGHLEEVEDQRENLVQSGVKGEQASRHLVASLLSGVGVGDGEVVPQQRQDGQQRNPPAVGDARRPPHRDAPSGRRADELLAEPALAHPGFADHTHHLKAALDRPGESVLQGNQLPLPTHQPRGPQRGRRPGRSEATANGLPNTYTPSGCRTPFTVFGPRSSRPNQPSTNRAVCSVRYARPGSAIASIR